jgi:hypothetical protein
VPDGGAGRIKTDTPTSSATPKICPPKTASHLSATPRPRPSGRPSPPTRKSMEYLKGDELLQCLAKNRARLEKYGDKIAVRVFDKEVAIRGTLAHTEKNLRIITDSLLAAANERALRRNARKKKKNKPSN